MSSRLKLLADTNVIIGLEDPHPVQPQLARLSRLCTQHGIGIFVHQASIDDVQRDADVHRREVTLSKLNKFPLLNPVPCPGPAVLEARFGRIATNNDRSDVELLLAVGANAVDFLVSEDIRLRRRANRAQLGERVLDVAQAIEWVSATFGAAEIALPTVEARKAYEVNQQDPIFDSLRSDYRGFDKWFAKCCRAHRDCWVLGASDGRIAGIVIRKDELQAEALTTHGGDKILKICTFKVQDEYRGDKFGELLLKQVLWHAQHNGYDLVYLTAFPKQGALIELLSFYGFGTAAELRSGEIRMEKIMAKGALPNCKADSVFDEDRRYYPRFHHGAFVSKFCVPIRAKYHAELFPEIAQRWQLSLFSSNQAPGNTIRKVYVCRAQSNQIKPGSVLLFYVSKDDGYLASQSITTIGIAEQVMTVTSSEDLVRYTARRSVFSEQRLRDWDASECNPIKLIFFLLTGHFIQRVSLGTLRGVGALRSAPQSITQLDESQYRALEPLINIGFEI